MESLMNRWAVVFLVLSTLYGPMALGQQPVEDKVLVQVFVYGLGVFDFDRTPTGSLVRFSVNFPYDSHHTPELGLGREVSSKFEWFGLSGTGPLADLHGKTIRFDLSSPLTMNQPGPDPQIDIDGFPDSQEAAADSRWLLPSSKHESLAFDPMQVSARAVFSGGRLETCGLVHDPTLDEICRITNVCETADEGCVPKFNSGAAEYMVVREEIDDDPGFIQIFGLGSPEEVKPFELLACTEDDLDKCVKWENKYYKYVIDLVLRNNPNAIRREMRSAHHDGLRDMFVGAEDNWEVTSEDCSESGGTWQCHQCVQSRQPTCWNHLRKYFPEAEGAQAPICPFVEYP